MAIVRFHLENPRPHGIIATKKEYVTAMICEGQGDVLSEGTYDFTPNRVDSDTGYTNEVVVFDDGTGLYRVRPSLQTSNNNIERRGRSVRLPSETTLLGIEAIDPRTHKNSLYEVVLFLPNTVLPKST